VDRASPLLEAMEQAGGVSGDYHGQALMGHFGDPAGEYVAATESAAVFDRSHRSRLVVGGRAPGKMLNGVLAGVMPQPPSEAGGVMSGRSTYHAVLTPKGKMITDLWATLLGHEEVNGYLLDVPAAGREGLLSLFAKVMPPRFASVRDVTAETAMVAVVGPEAAQLVSQQALQGRVTPDNLEALDEGEWRSVGALSGSLMVTRTADVRPHAFLVTGPAGAIVDLWRAVVAGGARPAGLRAWSTLRVEAGRPAFGIDMDEETIPPEAGIGDRAIDHKKGCYTGQEVIVRIRDRGHVNRHLRLLTLGDVPTPAEGTELLAADGSGKVIGRITSAVQSPPAGGVIALAYVARDTSAVLVDGHQVSVPE
jgi:folate-binding protein YgfZ